MLTVHLEQTELLFDVKPPADEVFRSARSGDCAVGQSTEGDEETTVVGEEIAVFKDLFWNTYTGVWGDVKHGQGESCGLVVAFAKYQIPSWVGQFNDVAMKRCFNVFGAGRPSGRPSKATIDVTVPYLTNPEALRRGDVLWLQGRV